MKFVDDDDDNSVSLFNGIERVHVILFAAFLQLSIWWHRSLVILITAGLTTVLVGKHVVDFLLVLIELFSLVLRLRRYERLSVQNRQFRSNGAG